MAGRPNREQRLRWSVGSRLWKVRESTNVGRITLSSATYSKIALYCSFGRTAEPKARFCCLTGDALQGELPDRSSQYIRASVGTGRVVRVAGRRDLSPLHRLHGTELRILRT